MALEFGTPGEHYVAELIEAAPWLIGFSLVWLGGTLTSQLPTALMILLATGLSISWLAILYASIKMRLSMSLSIGVMFSLLGVGYIIYGSDFASSWVNFHQLFSLSLTIWGALLLIFRIPLKHWERRMQQNYRSPTPSPSSKE